MQVEDRKTGDAQIFSQRPWRIFALEAFLFFLTLVLGIATALKSVDAFKVDKIPFLEFIFYFIFTTLIVLLLARFLKNKTKKRIIFKVILSVVVFGGGLLFLEAWFSEPLPLILISFLIIWWWIKPTVLNQDILIISGMAGVGSILGLSLTPQVVILLLVTLSIYDFVAVYRTKHMVEMAKEMIESRAVLALVIPSDMFSFQESLEKIELRGNFLILGGGDVVFPLLFSVSLVSSSILDSLIVYRNTTVELIIQQKLL